MKKTILLLMIIGFPIIMLSEPKKGSVYLGYGVHKITARGDFKLSDKWIKVENSSTRLYFEVGGDWQKFNVDYRFSKSLSSPFISYPSNVWMFSVGAGIGQEFIFKNIFVIQPYLGVFYKYARFRDKDLVEAIGTYNIIRLDNNGKQIGKTVDNAYGNLFTIDLGSRIGFRIKERFEIGGSIGVSPAKFSTSNTLFGKYRGEKPYPNNFYIKRIPLKADIGFKFNF